MTSTPGPDGHEFSCDACGETFKPPRLGRGSEARDWHETWDLAKDAGWRAVKVKSSTGKNEWEHRCADCV